MCSQAFFLHKRSAMLFAHKDLIIQVGSDLVHLCSVIYKFVTTNTFNCHGTIVDSWNYLFLNLDCKSTSHILFLSVPYQFIWISNKFCGIFYAMGFPWTTLISDRLWKFVRVKPKNLLSHMKTSLVGSLRPKKKIKLPYKKVPSIDWLKIYKNYYDVKILSWSQAS